MRAGARVTTAQASTLERHQCYESILRRCGRSLYLCVGSAFTGNYAAAMAWKGKNDPDNLFEVLDTGAASGRLALITLLTARFAAQEEDVRHVVHFAKQCIRNVREFVFIDELKYLVRGGRVSKTGGFFGDLLHLKPVISPMPEGVRKEGMVRSRKGQLEFVLEKLEESASEYEIPVVLLQYSDNKDWLQDTVRPQVRALLPGAEFLLVPLSLTSGVHMGPGTWGLAFGDGAV
jgi:DegV family protein with EDD domain